MSYNQETQHVLMKLSLCQKESSLKDLYRLMKAIRAFEESLLDLFSKGVLTGTTHTCIGQEATAVGVVSAIDRDRDLIFSNHRGHGHFLSYCGEIERLYLEIMGKPEGICAGRGGSQHLHYQNFYSNGILGGFSPVAAGAALAEKQKGSGAISVTFLGDGALAEGVVYESFNIASLWRLPVLFVIENNRIAQSTPFRHHLAGTIKARFEAFDIPVEEYATTDVRQILSVTCQLIDRVRHESCPHGIIIQNTRLGPHSKGDDHRDPEDMKIAWEQDPLTIIRSALDEEVATQITHESTTLVQQALERAMERPKYEC